MPSKLGYEKHQMRVSGNSKYRPEQFVLKEYFKVYAPNLRIELEVRAGPYTIDLADWTNGIAWELDGGYHNPLKDAKKDEYLNTIGWKVNRIKEDSWEWNWLWNSIVKKK